MKPQTPQANRADEFVERLIDCGFFPLRASGIDILQMNITRQCNLMCKHCHVQAGPQRREAMSRDTLTECIKVAGRPEITTIDITGGAPEMHPDFEWLIGELAALKKRLIVRSNLVVLLDPAYRHYLDVLAANNVEVVGSLPDYHAHKVDRQRGSGTFESAIQAIRALNRESYGVSGSGRALHLVHNPVGAYLPGPQHALEAEYRRVLRDAYDLEFNTLFCLVNNPIGRYRDYLERSENLADYMRTLRRAFNPQTLENLMCRTTLSVGWDGRLYDCDFNQMLNLPVNSGAPDHIKTFDIARLAKREIVVRSHCFACTAGAGSSCQGTLAQ
jgi:radical SAM/Cys-rich protein